MECPAIEVRSVSKYFAGNPALSGMELTVMPGKVHALVGANGSGKSTLIKILSGYHVPDEGTVKVNGDLLHFGSPVHSYKLGCRFVHQELGLIADMSVADNLHFGSYRTRFATLRRNENVRSSQAMLDYVGLSLDVRARVASLASAQRTGVALARALRADAAYPPGVVVLDEPTAALPGEEVGHLLEMVRSAAARGVAVIYVTHHLDEIYRIADDVSVLRDGVLVKSSAVSSLPVEEVIDLMTGSAIQQARDGEAGQLRQSPLGEPVLVVSNLASGAAKDISLTASPGEIVGIAGLTGSGRELILGAVFGAVSRAAGDVCINGAAVPPLRVDLAISAGAAYLPSDRKAHGVLPTLTARENLVSANVPRAWAGLMLRKAREKEESRRWFTALSVRPVGGIDQEMGTFSGGNQQKILLAKWMRVAPKVLLLDEPSQGIDVAAKEDLYAQILRAASQGTAIVIASADYDELVRICTRVLVLRSGAVVKELKADQITEGEIMRHAVSEVPGALEERQ